jgi:hypothetical protein
VCCVVLCCVVNMWQFNVGHPPVVVSRTQECGSYERGTRVPKRKHDQTDAVALAQRHFPGTASWFDIPKDKERAPNLSSSIKTPH